MQSFGDFYANNRLLAVAALLIAIAVIIAVGIGLYRLVFGRRLHMSGGGRTRQPRLGVVDAFDLDRQRQLVLVRRDNVEHLVMIGGPNDVVIETAIVRAAGPSVSVNRDKENGALAAGSGLALPPAVPQPVPAPAVHPSLPVGAPAQHSAPIPQGSRPAEPSVAVQVAAEPSAGAPVPNAIPERSTPAQSDAPRTTPTPARSFQSTPPLPRPSSSLPPRAPAASPTPRPAPSTAGPMPPRPVPSRATPLPARPAPRPEPGAASTGAPASGESSPPPQGERAPQSPARPPDLQGQRRTDGPLPPDPAVPALPANGNGADVLLQTSTAPRLDVPRDQQTGPASGARPAPVPKSPQPAPAARTLDTLESLEEEMAKLLGRPAPPADRS